MICPHCNKEIDTDNVSNEDKDHAPDKGYPFAPSDALHRCVNQQKL